MSDPGDGAELIFDEALQRAAATARPLSRLLVPAMMRSRPRVLRLLANDENDRDFLRNGRLYLRKSRLNWPIETRRAAIASELTSCSSRSLKACLGAVWRAEQSHPVRRASRRLEIIKLGWNTRRSVARFEGNGSPGDDGSSKHCTRFRCRSNADGRPFFVMDWWRREATDTATSRSFRRATPRSFLFWSARRCSTRHQKGIFP